MSNVLNIVMDQGSSLEYTFSLTNEDGFSFSLAGYDARLQVRRTYGDTSTLINCTLANGKLVISDVSGGELKLVLAPTDTSSIRFNNRDDEELEAVYDLELQSALGQVVKPARGTFTLRREVTR
jgi:hypothetical protein